MSLAITTAVERCRKLSEQADRMCRGLDLVAVDESNGHGRYYLRQGFGTGFLWAEVVTLRHGILVYGDCESVVFRYYSGPMPRGPLYWMGTYNAHYAEEKARIGGMTETTWDAGVARSCVADWRNEDTISEEAASELLDAIECEDQHAFVEALSDHDVDDSYDAGEVTPWRVFAAQGVLRRLIALLEQRDFRAQARAWFQREAA